MGQVLHRFTRREKPTESNTANSNSLALLNHYSISTASEAFESEWVTLENSQSTAKTSTNDNDTEDGWESDCTTTLESRGPFTRSETTGKSGSGSGFACDLRSSSSASYSWSFESDSESLDNVFRLSVTGSSYSSDTSVGIPSLLEFACDDNRIEIRLLRQRWADVCWEVLIRDYLKGQLPYCETPVKQRGLRTKRRSSVKGAAGRQWTQLYAIYAHKNSRCHQSTIASSSIGEQADVTPESLSISSLECDYHTASFHSFRC